MSRRSSRQKMIVIACFGLQNGCLLTKRREKEKQRKTRAARQRESSVRCASQRKPRCRSGDPKSAMELTDREPTGIRRARVTASSAMIRYCGSGMISPQASQSQLHKSGSPDCNRWPLRTCFGWSISQGSERAAISTPVASKRVTSARSFDGGRFDVAPQRSTSGKKRVTLVLRRLSWACGAGRPGHRERFPRSNCAQEGSGHTDRGPAELHGAHIPVALRAGGPSGGAADSLVAAAVHYARSGRRYGGCRCSACRRVP